LTGSDKSLHFHELHIFSISTVYISKEIIQRGDIDKYPEDVIETHLIQALSHPTGTVRSLQSKVISNEPKVLSCIILTGKLAWSGKWTPDGRYVEDYLLHKSLKLLRHLDVVGFSVNPEHCRG
jgi:hypothetical protein